MLPQYLEDKTERGINVSDLDKRLIDFSSLPFTSSVCYFISVGAQASPALNQARRDATGKLLSLVSDLEKRFPPKSDTDISGIEEIYQ